jgi:hypothetical protein
LAEIQINEIAIISTTSSNMDRENREGKAKGRSDKRITESKAQRRQALHCAQT